MDSERSEDEGVGEGVVIRESVRGEEEGEEGGETASFASPTSLSVTNDACNAAFFFAMWRRWRIAPALTGAGISASMRSIAATNASPVTPAVISSRSAAPMMLT